MVHLQRCLVVAWLLPCETAAVSRHVLCTAYYTTMYDFTVSLNAKAHTQGAFVSSCNLHFLQNDRDLVRATAVTRGWNRYRNKSQHRKSTMEKKISSRSCRDSNPRPFGHESGALTTELSPLPLLLVLSTEACQDLHIHSF